MGNCILNSFSIIKLGWLKVLLRKTCPRLQKLGSVILCFHAGVSGGTETELIYPKQVNGLMMERTASLLLLARSE